MAFRESICLAALLCVLGAQPVRTQEKQYTQIPGTDPFNVGEGSSFSASSSNPAGSRLRGPVIKKELIEADIEEALETIRTNHISGPNLKPQALTDAAITSMLKVLDPHSNYYSPAEFQDLLGEHESEYSGTGSSIAGFKRNGRIDTFVISTFPGSPAAKAGLRFGDRIIAVNGQNVTGESPDVIRDLVRGKKGSVARMTIERADNGVFEIVEMKRDRVHEPAVPQGFLLKGNVGYIDLSNGFSNATFNELETAFADLQRQGMTSLVLDIRGNGGGILEQAIKVAEKFLPAGSTIVSQQGRYPDDTRTWKAGRPKYDSLPLVIVVDENTASASEVLAGALQDNDRALIVGEKTFGKGLVQSVLNLPDGAGLTLTAARYFTPTGRSIQRNYADLGLYDYYQHRQPVEISTSVFAAKTLTDRVVYGGDGITPDAPASSRLFSDGKMRLLDPIFFFALDRLNPKQGMGDRHNSVAVYRQKILFGEPVVDDSIIREFRSFASENPSWAKLMPTLAREDAFVRAMLRYYLAMGSFGVSAANRAKIDADPQIAQAIALLPRSATLAAAAQKARLLPKKQKSSLSLVLSEQGRNRRN